MIPRRSIEAGIARASGWATPLRAAGVAAL